RRGIIFVLKTFVKVNALVMFVLVDAAQSIRLADDVTDRIVRARTRRQSVGNYPDTFEAVRVLDHLGGALTIFFLHPLPSRRGFVDMSIRGNQSELVHLCLL